MKAIPAIMLMGTALLPSGAIGQQPTEAQPLMVKLISLATATNNWIDQTGKPGHPGDMYYVFSERLFPATEFPTTEQIAGHIGTVDGRCVLIDGSAARYDCSLTSHFPDGDIMLAGSLTLTDSPSTFAVVGGTRNYRDAGGEVSVKVGPPAGPHEVTITLSGTECAATVACALTAK